MAEILSFIKGKIKSNLIDRSAFLYMNPRGQKKDSFAQCGNCMMFTGDFLKKGVREGTCTIIGPKTPIDGKLGSCGLFVPGPNHTDMVGKEMKATTAKEAGYVEHPVRCENCKYFDEDLSICDLFDRLTKEMPTVFELDVQVDPYGCCNAQTPRK